jgi:hypothetical protein
MKWLKGIAVVLVVMVCTVTGCMMVYDLYPAKIPRSVVNYVGQEPNTILWPNIGTLKDYEMAAVSLNLTNQFDFQTQMNRDQLLFTDALKQVKINLSQAEAERAELIGTVSNPGWLLMLLLGTTGVGGYIAGYKKQRPEDYTEAEHQAAMAEEFLKRGIQYKTPTTVVPATPSANTPTFGPTVA